MTAIAENYQLKWHSFTSHLHSCVAASLTSENFSDVSLFTLDGHRILAHRFILSACSQYLHQILKTHRKINTTLPILIVLPPEINYKTLKILIQYMYCGETTVAKDVLESVLRGGDLLKIRGLWRPREDEFLPKKLVKVNQKHEISKSQQNKENVQSEVKNQQKVTNEANINDSSVIKCAKENKTLPSPAPIKAPETPKAAAEEKPTEQDEMQFLVIKEEPIEWDEVNDDEMEVVNESEMFHTEMTIKPEIYIENEQAEDECEYSPLTCELCTETFTIPAEWVRHIQTHTDMLPAKRQRRGRHQTVDDNGTFPPLQCDMCQNYFPTPAEWVHHVQNIHTESELRLSNKKDASPKPAPKPKPMCSQGQVQHKVCSICNKKFPSHASMLIHKRTHTGERPYMCQYCCKGFNVKSNLLRHLRTLHDKIVNSTDVDLKEEDGGGCANEENVN